MRSIVAVVVGYLIYASLLMGSVLSLFADVAKDAPIEPMLLGKAIAAILIAALVGGGASAMIADHHPGEHGAMVGLIGAAVAVLGLVQGEAAEPTWFRIGTAALVVPAGWVAGFLVQNIKSRK